MAGTIDHANITVKFDVLQTKALDLGTAQLPIYQDWTQLFSSGTGSGQASQVWQDTRTLAASATENLDLAGSLTNAFGDTLTFTKVKLIAVKASSANNAANAVQVSRGSSNGVPVFLAASDGIALAPGAVFLAMDPVGWTVTASTGDILTVTNSAGTNSVTYDVLIVGAD